MKYVPGDSDSGMFGGNSNWRGPVWMPINVMLIRALFHLYLFYGDTFTVECPTGSGRRMHLFDVARDISRRLVSVFLRDARGGAQSMVSWRSSRPIRVGATAWHSLSISMEIPEQGWGPVTRRAGPASWQY